MKLICIICGDTVYPIDSLEVAKIGTIHADCLKCCKCSTKLNVGNHKTYEGGIYCGSHYKAIQDEINQKGRSNMKSSKATTGSSNKKICPVCNETVFPMDSIEIEKIGTIHSDCLKCCKCSTKLNVGNHKTYEGGIYCGSHYKAIQDEINQKGMSNVKSSTLNSQGMSNKKTCVVCNEIVYPLDLLDLDKIGIIHESCLKCYNCSTKLNMTNYKTLQGSIYCFGHYKAIQDEINSKGRSNLLSKSPRGVN